MTTANWKDEYSVNVEKIDDQHKKLIQLVTNLHTVVIACIDKNELKKLLIELVEYTRMHFASEEKLMKKYKYPESKSHHKDHKILLQHLDQLIESVANGKHPTFYSDYDVSSDWAMLHITKYDTKLGTFLNSKDVY